MKLFLDTNIFIEFIEHRKQYEPVSQIIDAIIEEQHTACISTGCLYTLAYLFERGLKLQDIHKPELTLRIRHLLAEVLNMSTIVPLAHANAETAVYDESFTDIEDSFQYRCALENRCHVLITINDNDYKNGDLSQIEILTPSAFVEKYINNEMRVGSEFLLYPDF